MMATSTLYGEVTLIANIFALKIIVMHVISGLNWVYYFCCYAGGCYLSAHVCMKGVGLVNVGRITADGSTPVMWSVDQLINEIVS